ncbi:hypothetical protein [Chitinophaga sp. Cy-1792]|uniref:hypothetical protein n=1 Tax=Chitinophaga sp. Cy-1792 TaxID=2608339 RepID=UPI00141DB49D|nr:hypothetical protein [Chitinophaga sp. Cy-1792]NIG55252.1 hypothetical protein [Chitinophaga sp. Cy-1792]
MPRFETYSEDTRGIDIICLLILVCDATAIVAMELQGQGSNTAMDFIAVVLAMVLVFRRLFYYFGMELSAIDIEDSIVTVRWETRSGKVLEESRPAKDLYYKCGTDGGKFPEPVLYLIEKKYSGVVFQSPFVRIDNATEWNLGGLYELMVSCEAAGVQKEPGSSKWT